MTLQRKEERWVEERERVMNRKVKKNLDSCERKFMVMNIRSKRRNTKTKVKYKNRKKKKLDFQGRRFLFICFYFVCSHS